MKYFPKKLTMTWIRNSYKEGSLTPEELAGEIVRRAEKYRDYNIWIVAPDLKRMMDYIEKLPKDMESLPLWGIPFAVKDNIDVAGSPTTAACPDYAYDPEEDAAVVKKLIKAGAFPVGKTNLDQFATGLVGTRSPYGEVKNALDPELISGGSSSGSAVSVALGMAAFSLGTDTAGSGRVPAALNCLVGYKPSLGAWSTKEWFRHAQALTVSPCSPNAWKMQRKSTLRHAAWMKSAAGQGRTKSHCQNFRKKSVWQRRCDILWTICRYLQSKMGTGEKADRGYGDYRGIYRLHDVFKGSIPFFMTDPGWQSAGKISVISWRATREKYFR